MTPIAVMNTEVLGFPVSTGEVYKTKTTMKLDGGLKTLSDNSKIIRQAVVQLITNHHLRAAHVFRFNKNDVDWHLFEPAIEPLNQNEIKGQMILAVQSIKKNGKASTIPAYSSRETYIKNRGIVIEYIEKIDPTESVFFILVFSDRIFIVGNYFDEHTLCTAMIHQRRPPKRMTWPKPNPENQLERLIQQGELKKRLFLGASFYSSKRCYKKHESKNTKGVKKTNKSNENNQKNNNRNEEKNMNEKNTNRKEQSNVKKAVETINSLKKNDSNEHDEKIAKVVMENLTAQEKIKLEIAKLDHDIKVMREQNAAAIRELEIKNESKKRMVSNITNAATSVAAVVGITTITSLAFITSKEVKMEQLRLGMDTE